MCGRYSLAPDQSKEIAQIVAEVQARFGAASIHTGEIFPTNAAPILLPDGQKMTPKPMTWGFPSFKVPFSAAKAGPALSGRVVEYFPG